jgi:ABC-type lipoprotein export system ATPase subunit
MFLCDRRITSKTTDAELAHIRLHNLGFVFQVRCSPCTFAFSAPFSTVRRCVQTFNLLPTMTAMENVMVPMVMAGLMSSKERHARARELLGRVGMSTRAGLR